MNCSACGLPPIVNQRLKQCKRCKAAWYHGIECQKQHYPVHKHECRRLASSCSSVAAPVADNVTTDARTSGSTFVYDGCDKDSTHKVSPDGTFASKDERRQKLRIEYTHPLSECQVQEGKGRSLIATTELYIGCHPLNPVNKGISSDGWCQPLVPPVLMEEERQSRCSYCFKRLGDYRSSLSMHNYCSKQCKEKDENCYMEENAVQYITQMFPNAGHPSPTVLLCSRILHYSSKTPEVARKFEQLCFNTNDLSEKDKEEYLQVMRNCSKFLRFVDPYGEACDKARILTERPSEGYKFMSRIMLNGFTISTLDQQGVGIGIYPEASMINHSCRPNAVQSFYFFPPGDDEQERKSNVPMLQITMCQKVSAGEEITISYCDCASPAHKRRKELWEGYKFHCYCPWCQDIDANKNIVGLKCPDSMCRGRVVSTQSDHIAEICDEPQYKCDGCGYSFEKNLAERTQYMKNIERTVHSKDYWRENVEDTCFHLNKTFDHLKQICNTQSSWYIASCADAIVNWSIDALGHCREQQMRDNLCIQALRVIDQNKSAIRTCYQYPGCLKWYTLLGIEAKLRLLMNHTDIDAFRLLWDARRYFLLFVPEHDEVIDSLDSSIMDYSHISKFDRSDPLDLGDEVRIRWILNGCPDYGSMQAIDNIRCRHLPD